MRIKDRRVRVALLYALSLGLISLFLYLDNTTAPDQFIVRLTERRSRSGYWLFFLYAIFKYGSLAVGILIPVVMALVKFQEWRAAEKERQRPQ